MFMGFGKASNSTNNFLFFYKVFIINVKQLIAEIDSLKKSRVRDIIHRRITSFEKIGKSGTVEVFKELCFCLLTAGFRADRCIKIQRSIDNGFLKLPEKQLAEELKKNGYRFYNIRAKYIVDARKYAYNIDKIEKQLELLSRKISLTLAELDLYLWYIETSTVLK